MPGMTGIYSVSQRGRRKVRHFTQGRAHLNLEIMIEERQKGRKNGKGRTNWEVPIDIYT